MERGEVWSERPVLAEGSLSGSGHRLQAPGFPSAESQALWAVALDLLVVLEEPQCKLP